MAVIPNRPQRGRSPGVNPVPEFPLDTPVPKDFGEALRVMVDRPFLASQKWQEQQGRASREGAHRDILDFERVLIKRMGKLGVPMFAHWVVRTEKQQLELFQGGHSKDSPADGQWPHRGCAVDIVHSVKGWGLSKSQWALVGHVGKELALQRGLKVDWGGDWRFYDPAHWQITGWKLLEGYPWPETDPLKNRAGPEWANDPEAFRFPAAEKRVQ